MTSLDLTALGERGAQMRMRTIAPWLALAVPLPRQVDSQGSATAKSGSQTQIQSHNTYEYDPSIKIEVLNESGDPVVTPQDTTLYRALESAVKRHHPDANGGDRSTEDHLVAVIQAYNYLKSAKFC